MNAESFPVVKVCTGPSHDGPIELPVDEKHWYFHKSGPKKGKPTSRCCQCINWHKVKMPQIQHGSVSCVKLKPVVIELVRRCGGNSQAALKSGLSRNTFVAVLNCNQNTVQVRTAAKIIDALIKKRHEDRVLNQTNIKFNEGVKKQAVIEDELERMVGY